MNKALLIALASVNFTQAASRFHESPGGKAWSDLEEAMWALQGAQQVKESDLLAIADMPLRDVISNVANTHKKSA